MTSGVKLLTVAALLLSTHCLAAGARAGQPVTGAPEASQAAARSALAALESAFNGKDMDALLSLYAPDSLLRQDVRARGASVLGLDSLRCRERLGAIYARRDTIEAEVCEEFTWVEHGRPEADDTWRTMEFVPGGDRLRIVADQERDYARARSTDLRVDLRPEKGTISGSATLSVQLRAPGEDALLLRLNRGLDITSIRDLQGRDLQFSRVADMIRVSLPSGRAALSASSGPGAPDSLTLRAEFDGTFFNESRELHYSQVGIAPGGSFASWVTSWYPHLAGTYSKSPGRITYVVPEGITVASSGRRVESTVEKGRSRQVFLVKEPLDFSFAAAPYYHESRNVDGIDLGVYFLRGGKAKANLYISTCARILSFLRGVYGFYPFDGYAVVEVPSDAVGGLGGSSEQGMNIFPVGGLPDSTFPMPLLSHEIGHSWWGNLVLGDDAAVLDEGLAQTTAVLCLEAIAGEKEMRRFLRTGFPDYMQSARMYFYRFADVPGQDLPLRTRAADSDKGMTLHDLADTKGFFVYEMLREEIGDAAFRRGLRRAVTGFARKKIRLIDLQRIWEKESGRDLGWFFEQWFARSGAPEFQMAYTVAPAGSGRFEIRGSVTQTGEPYRARAEIVLARAGKAPRIETLPIEGRETPFRFTSDSRPDTVLFDPGYKLLRWTDEYRHHALVEKAVEHHDTGDADSAGLMLARYIEEAPTALNGHCRRGRWALEAGDVETAEREFRWIADRTRDYDPDVPDVTWSEVGLGEIADLRGRREEAVRWYREALARADGSPALREAAQGLAAPYRPTPPPTALDPALRERCVGTYVMAEGPSLRVSIGRSGVLTVSMAGWPSVGLREVEGSRFRGLGDLPITYDFAGGGARFSQLTIESQGRTFHLERKE